MNEDTKTYVERPSIASDQDLSFRDIKNWLTRNYLSIISITVAISIGSIFYSLSVTELFTAETKIMTISEDSTSSFGGAASGLAALTGISLNGESEVSKHNEYMAILKSRKFLIKFFQDEEIKDVIFPGFSYSKSVDKFLANNFSVDRNIRTGITTLSLTWKDSSQASEWLNKIVISLNDVILQRDLVDLNTRAEKIKTQLKGITDINQREILFGILSKQLNDINLAESRKEYAIKTIDPSIVPEERSHPRRTRIVMFWTLMGFVFSIVSVLIFSLFTRKEES